MIELQHLDMESSQPTLADCVASPELVYDTYSAEAVSLAFSVYCGTPATPRMLPKEGFLAAWRAQESNDRTKGSRRAWLLSIVRNRAIDLLRAQHRRPALPLKANFDTADKVDVAGEAAVHVDAKIARRALTAPAGADAGVGAGVF